MGRALSELHYCSQSHGSRLKPLLSKVDSMVPWYGPLTQNPSKPVMTPARITFKIRAHILDPLQEASCPYQGPSTEFCWSTFQAQNTPKITNLRWPHIPLRSLSRSAQRTQKRNRGAVKANPTQYPVLSPLSPSQDPRHQQAAPPPLVPNGCFTQHAGT